MLDQVSAAFALKDLWSDERIKTEAYRDHPYYAMVPKMESWKGKAFHYGVGYGNPQARSASISTAIANKGNSTGEAFIITSAKDYSVFSVDDETILATEDEGAQIEALDYESRGAMLQLKNSIAHALWNDGSGKLGQVGALAGSKVTLTDPEDIVEFEVGMKLRASATLSGGVLRTGVITIATIDRDEGSFTFTSTITGLAVSDFLYAEGDYDAKAKGVSSWIPAILTNTLFFGVDRTKDSERLGGIRFPNGDQNTQRETLLRLMHRVHRGRGRPKHIFERGDMYANLEIEMGSSVQYVETPHEEIDIGFTGILIHGRYGKAVVYADDDVPGAVAFALEMESWELMSRKMAPHLKQTDGQRVVREANADGVEGRWASYFQLRCKYPGHNGRTALPV